MDEPIERDDAYRHSGVPGAGSGSPETGTGDSAVRSRRVRRRKRSMWEDRRVRAMGIGALVLVILYLLTVISALYMGLLTPTAPRTVAERDVMAWESATRAEDATIEHWQSYILALIADSQYQRARTMIEQVDANGALDQSRGANMLYCTGVLYTAQGRYDEALDAFTEVMELTRAAYEEELQRGDAEGPNWAMAFGIHDNYYFSATSKAAIYREQSRWAEGIEMLDVYLEDNPQAAGILVDRAYLKTQMGDLEGAEADYREALRYVPDFEEAREGLQEIGAGE